MSHDYFNKKLKMDKIKNSPPKTNEIQTLWGIEIYNRLKLFPWWVSYHKGNTIESELRENIISIGHKLGMKDKWLKKILRHTVSEFSKKGLGSDYYGYHNIQHELEAAYFTLLSIDGLCQSKRYEITRNDICYLFVSALFHDYDPGKEFDKPNEDCVEFYIRNDKKITTLIEEAGLDLNIVVALIHRTAYPFEGKIADHARNKIQRLMCKTSTTRGDAYTTQKIEKLGWLLSVSERMAGYALGGIEHARDMARRNAHALGWHPSVINKNSVKFFDYLMKNEKEMFDMVISAVPQQFRTNFYNNVANFKESWNKELSLRDLKKGSKLVFVTENNSTDISNATIADLLEVFGTVPTLMRINENEFIKSIHDLNSIIVTMRLDEPDGKIIGYAKGGPLECYSLRPGTIDRYYGRRNTVYLEGISVIEGYWGGTGGHYLRIKFLNEALGRRYKFLTGYAHRDVILQRRKKLEMIDIVRKYDPDMLDYYRIDLNNSIYKKTMVDSYDLIC